ncbi:MAG TPA: DNA helicase RecG [Chloroflexi bacterium]|nr:DNA helicase RecG [Chloroflexota bacterium]
MKPSIEKLQKFFRLEADRNYDNKAVMGGLQGMLESWELEARADQVSEDLIQAVVIRLRDYQRLSETSRKETLHGIWSRVQRESGVPEPEKALAPPETPRPQIKPEPPAQVEEIPAPQQPSEPEDTPIDDLEDEEILDSFDEEETLSITESPQKSPRGTRPEGPTAALNASVTVLPRLGERKAKTLEKVGIFTLGDMLYYFPRRYDDYSQLTPINRLQYNQKTTVIGTVQSVSSRKIRNGRITMVEAIISDGTAALRVTWFNQPWITTKLKSGMQIVLSGKVEQYLGRATINGPEWEMLDRKTLHTNRIVPIYALTANITQRWLRSQMHQVVSYWAPRVPDPLPESVLDSADLIDLNEALLQAHFPDSLEALQAARHRLAFDEIFLLQIGVIRQKQAWQDRDGHIFEMPEGWLAAQLGQLPFQLTAAQQRALEDVRGDLASGHPMNRLLQGDVGSGKTVIAALAAAMVTQAGTQAALMAPTSILAEQHYKSLLKMLTGEGRDLGAEQIRLMVGATPEAEKAEIRAGLETGEIKIIIGTHALIEDPVNFADLELAIIDEQHRFGVEQRSALRSKGSNPHLLVMTATPIPRSLALSLYGDLDLSVIDELPPGRQIIDTHVITPRERERAYRLIRTQIETGRQAFIIYPLVEESEKSEEKAAVEEQARLQKEIFPELKIGLLHGRMRPADKEDVMTRFRDGEYQVLVSTSVVEVGVDVPNATVMLIEGAHRFGLAQLHQFRGRVGRGEAKSYCLLIPGNEEAVDNERLQAMEASNDGFVLAERDLEQRGPGDFLGTRQSGYAELKMAKLTDVKLIEKARREAIALFEIDPDLSQPEHELLGEALERFWNPHQGDIS